MAGQQVLIIEDNRELSHLLETVLERQGYQVSYAAHGGEELRLQQRAPRISSSRICFWEKWTAWK